MSDRRTRKVQALLEKFRTVAKERLERLNNAFLTLESAPEDEGASSTFLREIHTLKGEAKLMGFQKVNVVAHKTEDLVFRARDQKFHFSENLGQCILAGLDLIEQLMEAGGDAEKADLEASLDGFLSQADTVLSDGHESVVPPASPRPPHSKVPLKTESTHSSTPVVSRSTMGAEPEPQERDDRGRGNPGDRRRMTIRVEVERLDFLADRVADIARYHTQLEQEFESTRTIGLAWRREARTLERDLRALEQTVGSSGQGVDSIFERLSQFLSLARELNGKLLDSSSRGQEVVFTREYGLRELETSVKSLRLVPLSTLFGQYPRALRDLAREQGKQAKLTIEGGELEVDNRVLENLEEPLLHVFRNAVDHGIETPSERVEAGKPEEGLVSLSALQGGSHVEIAISDDGRGLVLEHLLGAAIRRGLIAPNEAESLSSQEIVRLVLRSGFSTRDRATDVSGRGVGLDVVRARVESLGGSVGISGQPGLGTTIRLRVPISIALMPALVVRVGPVALAFPSHSLSSIVDVEREMIRNAGEGLVLRLDERHVPVEPLPSLLGMGLVEENEEHSPITRVLVVEDQGRQLGLIGGAIEEERELTLRPLDAFLRDLQIFVGTAILDYGEPALVVSVSELMRRAELGIAPSSVRAGPISAERSIVLVEDSEIVRDMIEGMLRGLGHKVLEAANGRDALVHLERQDVDIVITDLEMPVMDGFELIEQIRANPTTSDIPIVVLSSRGSAADKQRAGELGADAYLVKSEFSEERLVETLRRFLRPEGTRR